MEGTSSQEENNNITSPLLSKENESEENSPIKQVALTVPTTDDPSLPVLTFRMWVLGTLSCVLLSFLNQFFWYRTEPLTVTAISAQIAVVPLGQLMAAKITKRVFFKGKSWEFTLNPGPFNVKEHVLITIFANSGAGTVYAIHIVTAVKVFYHQHISFPVSFLVVITTQVLGFGWAGIFRRYLVEPAAMWWPANLVQVSLFRALHEKEERTKGGLTRSQFFVIAFLCSFAYYVFPGYIFQMLTSLSWICWVFPHSVLAQQLGSGLNGLGIGAIGLDWSAISAYLGSPLASPWFATANVAVGFVFVMYILTPLCYWFNVYNAKSFPIFSNQLFTSKGHIYNITEIIDSNFHMDLDAYEKQGRLYLSTFFAMTYGVGFAALTATVVHVALFHGREIWEQSKSSFNEKSIDIHTKLMRRYKQVPEWWFVCILIGTIATTIFACEYYNEQLQLPWWGVLLACGIAIFFTLPIGIITAITNQSPGLNVITEYIIGYIYPGYPVANMCFKVYGYISMTQAITFLQDFKLGHYMKIPPRTMFMAQVVGTLIAGLVYLSFSVSFFSDAFSVMSPSKLELCPSVKNILLLDSDGRRVAAKYFSDDWPTNSAKETFEKLIFNKTQKTNARAEAEIAMFENNIVVYKFVQDLHFFVTGSDDENELILSSILQAFFDSVGLLLRGNVDKKEALENLDLILLCIDEIIDAGIILETTPSTIAEKVGSNSTDSGAPLSEQTLSQALASAREHLARSLLK